ncbi:uncharacterized protein LOC111102108 isoform X2 [Crassostrea virginica]
MPSLDVVGTYNTHQEKSILRFVTITECSAVQKMRFDLLILVCISGFVYVHVHGCDEGTVKGKCDALDFCFCKNGTWMRTTFEVAQTIESTIRSFSDLCNQCTGSTISSCSNDYYTKKFGLLLVTQIEEAGKNCTFTVGSNLQETTTIWTDISSSTAAPPNPERTIGTNISYTTESITNTADEVGSNLQETTTIWTDISSSTAAPPNPERTTGTNISYTTESITNTAGQCCCSEDFQAKIQYWLNASNQRIHLKNLPSSLIAIKNELTVEKKNLSAIKNLRTCAPDQRPSAAVAGYLGAFIISLVLSLIILMDCSKLITNLRFCQLSSK